MSWKRHIRGINGQERMDKHQPPQDPQPPDAIRAKRKRWRSKFECYVNKGDHAYRLVKPNYIVGNAGAIHNMTPEEYYAWDDKRIDVANAATEEHNKARAANGLAIFSYMMRKHYRRYACIYCGHSESDTTEEPDTKLRAKVVQ